VSMAELWNNHGVRDRAPTSRSEDPGPEGPRPHPPEMPAPIVS
jgi:hypothetical protein